MLDAISVFSILAAVFMGISIGSSTVASAFGPVNSSGSANVLRSALLAGLFAFLGAITQGGNVTATVGSGLLLSPITTLQAAIILFVGASLVIISVLTDYPMPTAFTVVGAVIGVGYGFGSGVAVETFAKIAGYWIIIPFLAIFLGYSIASTLRAHISREGSEKKIRWLLLISGAYLAYSAGASAVGLAVGPLTSLNLEIMTLLVLGGLSILLGTWMYSPRIIKAISVDYSNVGPRRSVAALVTAAFLGQVGIYMGIPISFNEAVIASMIGSGLVEGTGGVDQRKIGFTLFAWIGAFLLAATVTFIAGSYISGNPLI